jgi:hypothetical protein
MLVHPPEVMQQDAAAYYCVTTYSKKRWRHLHACVAMAPDGRPRDRQVNNKCYSRTKLSKNMITTQKNATPSCGPQNPSS